MLGVVEPHANLDGVALPDPLEDVLHGLASKSLSYTFTFHLKTSEAVVLCLVT